MNSRIYAFLAVVAAGIFVLYNAIFIVNEREQAIVLRFGEIQRVIEEPGLYFKLPFTFARADNVQKISDRLQRLDLENLRVQTAEGLFYQVDAFLVYRIDDAGRFRQQVAGGSLELAEQRLRTRFDSAIRAVYGLRSFEAALSEERGAMMVEVRDQIRPEADNLGIALNDVRIRRTDLTEDISQQTYERMRAERLAEAAGIRAVGQVAGREIRAAADREVSEIIAGANRDAQILQGEGEAERNAIFAAAFGANPEFFEFYRSMEAYRGAMGNAGTTMVLSPDSDFFRYFNADVAAEGEAQTQAEPAASGPAAPEAEAPAPAPEAEAEAEASTAAPEVEASEEASPTDGGAETEIPPLSPAAEEARARAEEAARAINAGEEPPSLTAPAPGTGGGAAGGPAVGEPGAASPPPEAEPAPAVPAN